MKEFEALNTNYPPDANFSTSRHGSPAVVCPATT